MAALWVRAPCRDRIIPGAPATATAAAVVVVVAVVVAVAETARSRGEEGISENIPGRPDTAVSRQQFSRHDPDRSA